MKRARRRLWTTLVSIGASLVVLAALASATFQIAVLAVPGYREKLQAYVSEATGRPVEIGGVHLGWSGLWPYLELSDAALYSDAADAAEADAAALSVERVALGFSPLRLLRGDWMPSSVELAGLRLAARIDEDGRVLLQGFDRGGSGTAMRNDWLRNLERFRRIAIEDCVMLLADERVPGLDLQFRVQRAQAERRGERIALEAALLPPMGDGSVLYVEAQLNGDPTRPEQIDGHWQARLADYDGAPWLGPNAPQDLVLTVDDASLAADGVIRGGRIGPTTATLDTGRITGRRADAAALVERLSLDVHLQPQDGGLRLELSHLDVVGEHGAWPAGAQGQLTATRDDGQWRVDAAMNYLRLDDVAPWLALMPSPLAQAAARLDGEMHQLSLNWAADPAGDRYAASVRLQALALSPGDDAVLAFSGVSGVLEADEHGGHFTPDGSPPQIRLPKVFDAPLQLTSLSADATWTIADDVLTLDIPSFAASTDDAAGEGRIGVTVPFAQPAATRIDLALDFSAADVLPLKAFVPNQWTRGLGPWLRRGVEAGRVASGRLRIDGPVDGLPYARDQGRFELDLAVRDARLSFHPDWPSLQDLAGQVAIRNDLLTITGQRGNAAGAQVTAAQVRVDGFEDAVLVLAAELTGDATAFYRYLDDSPLASQMSALLTRTTATGPMQLQLDLSQPLRDHVQPEVSGSVRLQGVNLQVRGLDEPIEALTGSIAFDGPGALSAPELHARLAGIELQGRIESSAEMSGLLVVQGRFVPDAAGGGLSRYLPSWLRGHLQGASDVTARLPLGPADARLRLEGDLQGLAVSLPPPYAKPADAALPVSAAIGGTPAEPLTLDLRVGGQLSADLRFDAGGQLLRGQVDLGDPAPRPLPDAGLRVAGRVEQLALLPWIAVFAGGAQAPSGASAASAATRIEDPPAAAGAVDGFDPGALRAIDLDVAALDVGGFVTAPVSLSLAPHGQGIEGTVSGDGARGRIDWDAEAQSVQVVLNHLTLISGSLVAESIADDDGAAAAASAEAAADDVRDPSGWPAIDFAADQVRLADVPIGRLRLRTARIDGGQRLERLVANGDGLELEASGRWQRLDGRSSAELEFFAATPAIGRMMAALGYARTLTARSAALGGGLRWGDDPEGLDWADVDGFVEVAADNGSVVAVEPGAGRVLGLLNFYALPRRLSLDFRDVTESGLGFDQIDGSFEIREGIATTDNLEIDGPSVRVALRGDVDLGARRYDQRVTVYPDVSGGVTLGALLLGGPAAGLIALVAQQVLDKPLGQATQFSYHVTGPWENPQIERASTVERGP